MGSTGWASRAISAWRAWAAHGVAARRRAIAACLLATVLAVAAGLSVPQPTDPGEGLGGVATPESTRGAHVLMALPTPPPRPQVAVLPADDEEEADPAVAPPRERRVAVSRATRATAPSTSSRSTREPRATSTPRPPGATRTARPAATRSAASAARPTATRMARARPGPAPAPSPSAAPSAIAAPLALVPDIEDDEDAALAGPHQPTTRTRLLRQRRPSRPRATATPTPAVADPDDADEPEADAPSRRTRPARPPRAPLPTRTPRPTATPRGFGGGRPTATPSPTRTATLTATPVPRPLASGSRFVAVVAGASGTSVSGALTGRALLFGLDATLAGAEFTGLRLGTGSLSAGALRGYDTLVFLGVCKLDALTADERAAVREFVTTGGKLVLRDSNDAGVCPGDDRSYAALGLPFGTAAPPDRNAPAPVQVVAESPLASADPGSPYFVDPAALSAAPYSAGDAGYVTGASGVCASLVVAGAAGEQRVVRGWANVGAGTVVYDGWDTGDGRKANAPLAKHLWYLDLRAPWPLPASCPPLPAQPSVTPTATPSPSRTPSPSPTPSVTPRATPSATATVTGTLTPTVTSTRLPRRSPTPVRRR